MSLKVKSNGINFNVPTIESLPTERLEEDLVCVVTDENRGGVFVYREANALVNNGGTIFDGWTRQYSGLLDYKWFGLSSFKFYVSTTGSDSNNGFTVATPFLTIQKAIDTYATFRRDIGENCTIKLAPGTYTEGGVVNSIKSDAEIVIEGDTKANTIIDGTTSSNMAGLNFNNLGNGTARVKKITVNNFGAYGGSGIIFQNGTRGVIDTCDANYNREANFNCSEDSEMVIYGECTVTGGRVGFRYYGNSVGSIGNDVNTITIDGATHSGIVSRDGSKVVTRNNFVVKNCNAFCTTQGVLAQKDGYIELRNCTIQNNSIGISAENNSIVDTQTGTRTLIGNTIDYNIVQNSVDRSLFTVGQIPMQIFTPRSNPSGLMYNSNYDIILDYNGATGFQFLSNGNNININFDKLSMISHSSSDKTLRLSAHGAEYRYSSTAFYPATDNTRNLGQSFARWATIYAGTGTINTSDDREKTFSDIPEVEIQVAKELKALVRRFKFNDAIAEKGEDKARIHYGTSAQEVIAVFKKYGLDAFDYAMVCYDEWDEELEVVDSEGNVIQEYRPAGNRYGIRYEELIMFILGAM